MIARVCDGKYFPIISRNFFYPWVSRPWELFCDRAARFEIAMAMYFPWARLTSWNRFCTCGNGFLTPALCGVVALIYCLPGYLILYINTVLITNTLDALHGIPLYLGTSPPSPLTWSSGSPTLCNVIDRTQALRSAPGSSSHPPETPQLFLSLNPLLRISARRTLRKRGWKHVHNHSNRDQGQ